MQVMKGGRPTDYTTPRLDPYRSKRRHGEPGLDQFDRKFFKRCIEAARDQEPMPWYWHSAIQEAPTNYQTPANDTEL